MNDLSDERAVWDWIKYNIHARTICYSKNKAKQRKFEEMHLQNDYDKATKMFESDPSDLNKIRLNEIKEKLELFYEERVKEIIIRARARWYEHGERSSKYFLNLEKRNHVKRFYKDLYKSRSKDAEKDSVIDDFLSKLGIPKLSENQKQ